MSLHLLGTGIFVIKIIGKNKISEREREMG